MDAQGFTRKTSVHLLERTVSHAQETSWMIAKKAEVLLCVVFFAFHYGIPLV